MSSMMRLGPLYCHLARLAGRRRAEETGFLLGRASGDAIDVYAYVPVANLASSPARFLGDPWDAVVAHRVAENMGVDVVALFHTHPCGDPEPSGLDLEGMRRWPLIWVIAGAGGVRAWRLSGSSAVEVPLEGWPRCGGRVSR